MAFAQRQTARRAESFRSSAVCHVRTCARCQTNVTTGEPSGFVPSVTRLCLRCASQEQALSHLPRSRTAWGAALALTRRA